MATRRTVEVPTTASLVDDGPAWENLTRFCRRPRGQEKRARSREVPGEGAARHGEDILVV